MNSRVLPPDEVMEEVLAVYFQYCHYQPLALFHSQGQGRLLQDCSEVLLLTVLAIALRFSHHRFFEGEKTIAIDHYAQIAQCRISESTAAGKVELSTLQAMCLLSLVDFTGTEDTEDPICLNRMLML